MVRTGVLLAFLQVLCVPDALPHAIEFSGGVHTTFDAQHRQEFGHASAFSVAYSAPLSPRDVHLIIEVGYVYNTAQVDPYYLDLPPTVPDAHYWLVPITLGIRTNLIPERYQGPIGFYFGIGLSTLFTGIDQYGSEGTATSFGGMVELRPEIRLTQGVSVWVRNRFSIAADAKYDEGGSLDFSGATLQLGVSLGAP